MDVSHTPQEEAFKKELREWLAVALPAHRKEFPPSDDGLRYLTRQLRGEAPGPEGSVLKLTLTDTYREMAEAAAQIVGPTVQLWKGSGPDELAFILIGGAVG